MPQGNCGRGEKRKRIISKKALPPRQPSGGLQGFPANGLSLRIVAACFLSLPKRPLPLPALLFFNCHKDIECFQAAPNSAEKKGGTG